METQNVPTQARRLNMDEKRKLEKVLLADVDSAITEHADSRATLRTKEEAAVLANIPAEVRSLYSAHIKAKREVERTRKALDALGFVIECNYPRYEEKIGIGHSPQPKRLQAFNEETTRVSEALAALKRTYTLKLFAGGEEAQELFASLARELAGIVKQ